VYYSLDTNEEVDREPDTDKWDIVFTRYHTLVEGIIYLVTGVLQNIDVTAQESTDTDPLSTVFPDTGYLTNISTIGRDWKDYINNEYTIDETRVFFVKDLNEAIYRIKFKTFEGISTGNLSFDISTLK
jgi:hypothetical protein